jgi:hypothetical protein
MGGIGMKPSSITNPFLSEDQNKKAKPKGQE